jgi:hypothetical protein
VQQQRDALKERLAARLDVLEELFQTIPAQNILPQVTSELLRPGAPQANLAFAITTHTATGSASSTRR